MIDNQFRYLNWWVYADCRFNKN